MGRSDWLLLLLSPDALGAGGPEGLDPVRIQKGMFLLSKMGPSRDVYEFKPYHWGPFSRDIYSDLDALAARGLVSKEPVPGQSWSRWQATAMGEEHAEEFGRTLSPKAVGWVARLRRFLTTRSFNKLLDDVYEEFPEFAVRSQFNK